MTIRDNITDDALGLVTQIANDRGLKEAQVKHLMRVAYRIVYREGRFTITKPDIEQADNWCAEHGWK